MKNKYEIIEDQVIIKAYRKGTLFKIHIDKQDLDLVSSITGTWFIVKPLQGKTHCALTIKRIDNKPTSILCIDLFSTLQQI